jgi:endonuclease-3
LKHRNAFELLIATILSAQCTDVRVNMVTPGLFEKYPDAQAMSSASLASIESLIRSTGFYRNKAKSLKNTSRMLVEKHGGQVPDTMDELTALQGVARKTANVLLGNAFGKNEGVVVDTHVGRLSRRLGLTQHKDPKKVEQDLMAAFPSQQWTLLAHLLIQHGRGDCTARKPKCGPCQLASMCPRVGVE